MTNNTWINCTIDDVLCNGPNYMYSLTCDYERYVRYFGFISIDDFLQGWNCITFSKFANLQIGDAVYSPTGIKYIVIDEVFENVDGVLCVEVKSSLDASSTSFVNTSFVQAGDVYSDSVTHYQYRTRTVNKNKEEILCPILITKTNQDQN